jgi:hypothetical protein
MYPVTRAALAGMQQIPALKNAVSVHVAMTLAFLTPIVADTGRGASGPGALRAEPLGSRPTPTSLETAGPRVLQGVIERDGPHHLRPTYACGPVAGEGRGGPTW